VPNFLITYRLKTGNTYSDTKQMKVKNKDNEFIAKCSLEDYLRKRHTFDKLIIDNTERLPDFGGFDFFNDIFNTDKWNTKK
jgi:hypothetical protein